MWPIIAAGISIGVISSFHCVGMCGPLVLALPVYQLPVKWRLPAIIFYHIGRIATYALLGMVFGIVGRHIFISGYQRFISIAIGALILGYVLLNSFGKNNLPYKKGFVFGFLKKHIQRLWSKISVVNFGILGALNGLLPCGMVYFALATAVSFGAISKSIVFMLCFGAGTLLLMFSLHYFGSKFITINIRSNMRKVVPYVMLFTGCLLILRGLNLGIPYISPYIGTSPSAVVSCH